jgi:transposase
MLRLYAQDESKLKISDLTGVSRNTLKKYLKIYMRLGLSLPDIDKRSDLELDHV